MMPGYWNITKEQYQDWSNKLDAKYKKQLRFKGGLNEKVNLVSTDFVEEHNLNASFVQETEGLTSSDL